MVLVDAAASAAAVQIVVGDDHKHEGGRGACDALLMLSGPTMVAAPFTSQSFWREHKFRCDAANDVSRILNLGSPVQ